MRFFSFGLLLAALASAADVSSITARAATGATSTAGARNNGVEIDFSCTLSHSSNSDDCWENSGCPKDKQMLSLGNFRESSAHPKDWMVVNTNHSYQM